MAVTNKDIASASVGITDQKEMVKTTASDPNAQKGAEKTLDNLEDDKKDLQKDNKKKGEHLNDLEKENRQVARTMSSNDQNVDQKTAGIEVQKGVVRDVQAKLSNIK
jgi:hypothetical protein